MNRIDFRRPRIVLSRSRDLGEHARRRKSVEAAFGIEGIADVAGGHRCAAEKLVVARQGRGLDLLSHEAVDGGGKQTLVARKFLGSVRDAANVHDRHQIVRAEMAVDELLRPTLHPLCAERRRMQIIENEHIYPAGKWALVASNIGLVWTRGRPASGVSIGISTSAKPAIDCDLPSSKIWKSSFRRSRTTAPRWSVTMASTSTYSNSALNVGSWLGRRVGGLRCQRHGQECPERDSR